MASIRLDRLHKRYGDTVVVKDVTIDIPDDEFLVLVGPSGCGKTTTLRMVAGLEEISSGDVYIGDRRVNDVESKDRDIAMVFQSYALYPHMTVYDNMAFGLRQRKTPKAEIDRRIDEAANLLAIGHLLQRTPRALSGGQRQRVALGRAIVREPAVFLMDEPLSNLDAQIRANTRTELLRIHQRVKNTVIYVTHDQVEAMTMADRIVVMKDGVVQQIAPPKEIYERPANKFVASFIGAPSMNFVDAEVEGEGDALRVRSSSFSLDLAPATHATIRNAPSRNVVLGFRPENVVFGGDEHAPGSIPVRVDVVETLGAEQHLSLSSGQHTFLARVAADFPARIGDLLSARIGDVRLHVFDRDTGVAYC